MTKLTNHMREDIASRGIRESLKSEKDAMGQREHEMGMELYQATYEATLLRRIKNIPSKWFRMDDCLRFNCGGYDLRFTVKKAVPVPHSSHCACLAAISGDLGEKAQKFAHEKADLNKKENDAYRQLMAVVNSVSTIKQLAEVWPEGAKFYAHYGETAGHKLPAVQVAELNKTLGLAA